jgi:hydroxyacylglutathione hydrolase
MTEIHIIPAFTDNYIYALTSGDAVMIVDPGEAGPVLRWVETHAAPTHLLLTHHHSDHIGGAVELAARFKAQIVGAAMDAARLPKLDRAVGDGDTFTIGAETIGVIATPGHTRGHIAYTLPNAQAVFAGDTLFSLGCGRLFEGTAAEMLHSLKRLAALPPETRLYCGHEYTLANARFALSVASQDAELQKEVEQIKDKREHKLATIPSTIAYERRFNPFLKCETAEEFAELRQMKDSFKT